MKRFNAWRQTLVGGDASSQAKDNLAYGYEPVSLGKSLEVAVDEQIAWITAWRIGRYANYSYKHQPFFLAAKETSKDEDPETYKKSKAESENLQKEAEAKRAAAKKNPDDPNSEADLSKPGNPLFEPAWDQRELSEAAHEFRNDYFNRMRDQNSWQQITLDTIPRYAILLLSSDDEDVEYARMKKAGQALELRLFADHLGTTSSDPTMALVCALYDDQVHDSRAWFMYATLKSRELWSGYLRYRMIYFGDECSKSLSLVSVAGKVIGVATLVGGIIYSVRQKKAQNMVMGLAGTVAALGMERSIVDIINQHPVELVAGAEQLWQSTRQIGGLIESQKQLAVASQYQQMMDELGSFLSFDSLEKQVKDVATSTV
ncbi:hypothetical protein ACQ86O_15465 [Serratia sp. L9]|uniref:T6SS phospholipase effector Tle1-like catalytic domain-containing protein n=1 Tax=Serratia sp. L9 TaxID=3423946 RepID=UPI003D671773